MSWYRFPCSASGFQSVCSETVSGQPAATRSTPVAAATVVSEAALSLPPHAESESAAMTAVASSGLFLMVICSPGSW
jgi:hypothetical protein